MTYLVGGDDSPLDLADFFAQIPDACNIEDLLRPDESGGRIPTSPDPQSAGHIFPDPQSAGETSHSIAGLRQAVLYPVGMAGPTAATATGAENLPRTSPGLIQPPTYLGNAGRFTATGMAEFPPSWSPLWDFNIGEINATTADMGISSSPGVEVNDGAHHLPSGVGGGALTEATVGASSCKKKRLVSGSSSQRTTPPELESEAGLVQSDLSSPDMLRPPAGLNDQEIIHFLRLEEISMAQGYQVNLSLGKQDQICPKAIRSYVTTVEMMPDQETQLGYWKEKQVKPLLYDESIGKTACWRGRKRTFQFHRYDGTKTNWFMHEYIATDVFGGDLFMKGLRFREVYEEVYEEGAQVPVQGEPTSPEVKIKNNTAVAKKHRMRRPENLVIKGGCTSAKTPVRASFKRKKVDRGSSSQRSMPPEFNLVESEAGLIQSDPSSTDIKPPTGSTDIEIIHFLKREESSMPCKKEVNLSLGEHDQMAPKAVQSYATTVKMTADQTPHDLGYWKEKPIYFLWDDKSGGILPLPFCVGLKRTFQFHKYDGTKTNWFMYEYIPTRDWGSDLYMKDLRFREVFKDADEAPGEPTSPKMKIKNKIAATKKHRVRGPENMVIKGESPAWQHFVKIYDRHPQLEGSKVVYAVCCHCKVVLKAGTENGTRSLLTHCDRTCPVRNKKQQPSSSSYQENHFGVS